MYDLRAIFGKNLKAIRISRGLTQEKLGALSGLTAKSISDLERGKHNASWSNLATFCDVLDATPAEFLLLDSQKDGGPESIAYKEKISALRENILRLLAEAEI